MKKDKKYWKKQAKYFENQYWDAEYAVALLEEQLRVVRHKGESQAIALEATKRELDYFRQRNIGKKPSTDEWANEFMKNHNIPVGVDEATKRVINESATLPEQENVTSTISSGTLPNSTNTTGTGYFYNTTIDFTKPKNKNRRFWNRWSC